MNTNYNANGSLFVCLLLLVQTYSTNLYSQNVALFYNSEYTQIQDGKHFAEGSNLKTTLDKLNTPYFLTTDISFNMLESVQTVDYLVVPELEIRDLSLDLTSQATDRMSDFVKNGGSMVILGTVGTSRSQDYNCARLLNHVFDMGFVLDDFSWSIKGESYADQGTNDEWPKELPLNNSTILFPEVLPANATSLYRSSASDRSVILDIKVGNGSILYLGWSWWNALPHGVQDGGWSELLDFVLKDNCKEPVFDQPVILKRDSENQATITRADISSFETDCSQALDLSFERESFDCSFEGTHRVVLEWKKDGLVEFRKTIQVQIPPCQDVLLSKNGYVYDINNEGIEDVEAEFETAIRNSDAAGVLDIPYVEESSSVSFAISKEDSPRRLVNMVDLIILNRFLDDSSTYPLSDFQKIAADVHNNGAIDHSDYKNLRDLLSFRTQEFQVSPWLFIKDSEMNKAWQTISTQAENNILTYDIDSNIEILGVKRGDISNLSQLETRTTMQLAVKNSLLINNSSQWIEIPVEESDIEGVSLSLFFDPTIATIQDVVLPPNLDYKEAYLERGELLVEGAIRKPFKIKVLLEARENVELRQVLAFGSLTKSTLFYGHAHNTLNTKGVSLTFSEDANHATAGLSASEGFKAYPTVVYNDFIIENTNINGTENNFHIYSFDGKLLGEAAIGSQEKKVIKKGSIVNYFGAAVVQCIDCTTNKIQKIIFSK